MEKQATADDFRNWEKKAKGYSIDQLKYAINDCFEASMALPENENFYRDQGNTFSDELRRRIQKAVKTFKSKFNEAFDSAMGVDDDEIDDDWQGHLLSKAAANHPSDRTLDRLKDVFDDGDEQGSSSEDDLDDEDDSEITDEQREHLMSKGFVVSPTGRIHCDQCDAMAINGVNCHEQGCPNKPRLEHQDDDEPEIDDGWQEHLLSKGAATDPSDRMLDRLKDVFDDGDEHGSSSFNDIYGGVHSDLLSARLNDWNISDVLKYATAEDFATEVTSTTDGDELFDAGFDLDQIHQAAVDKWNEMKRHQDENSE